MKGLSAKTALFMLLPVSHYNLNGKENYQISLETSVCTKTV